MGVFLALSTDSSLPLFGGKSQRGRWRERGGTTELASQARGKEGAKRGREGREGERKSDVSSYITSAAAAAAARCVLSRFLSCPTPRDVDSGVRRRVVRSVAEGGGGGVGWRLRRLLIVSLSLQITPLPNQCGRRQEAK